MNALDEILNSQGNPVKFFELAEKAREELATLRADRDSEKRWAEQYHITAAQMEIERDAARAEVGKLQAEVELLGKYPGGWDDVFMGALETASKLRAEVARLNAELKGSNDNLTDACNSANALRAIEIKLEAEVARLREALEKLSNIDVDDGEYNSVWEQMYAVKTIARAALEVTK